MKTVKTKLVLDTEAVKMWEDLELPVAVSDQYGQLYLIIATMVDLDQDGIEETELYYLVNIMRGEFYNAGFHSVRELVQAYSSEDCGKLELKATTLEMAATGYPEVK